LDDKDFYNELKFILKGSCILNIVIYLLSLIFNLNISILLGLLLGTLILYINLNLLKKDINRSVEFGSSRIRLMCGYLLRYLLICSAFYFAVKVNVVNPYGVVVPQFYPRVLYTLKSIRNNKERSC